jgi:hypothetical protein
MCRRAAVMKRGSMESALTLSVQIKYKCISAEREKKIREGTTENNRVECDLWNVAGLKHCSTQTVEKDRRTQYWIPCTTYLPLAQYKMVSQDRP